MSASYIQIGNNVLPKEGIRSIRTFRYDDASMMLRVEYGADKQEMNIRIYSDEDLAEAMRVLTSALSIVDRAVFKSDRPVREPSDAPAVHGNAIASMREGIRQKEEWDVFANNPNNKEAMDLMRTIIASTTTEEEEEKSPK